MAKSLQRQRQRLQSILPKSFELQIRRYAPAQGSATRHLWASDQVVRPCTGFSYEASDFSCVAGDEPICGCHFVVRGTLTCELQSPSHLQKRILLDAHVCHDLLGREYLSIRQPQWSANQHATIFTIKSRSNSDQIQIMFHHQVPIKSRSSPVSSSTIKSQSS